MRAISIITASAVALFSASALAQAPASSARPGVTSPAPAAETRAPAPNPLAQEDVSKIEGVSVLGPDDKKLGHVSRVLMNPGDKTIDRLVVRTGDVFGIGGHLVAMPVTDFTWDGQKDAFKISKTEDDLKTMAEWKGPESAATATGSSQPARAPLPSNEEGK
jgi:hypothetical protein